MRLLAVLLLLSFAAPSPEIRYFRYERPVQNTPRTQRQACFLVDADVFPKASPGLADLRLYRDTTETPYILQTSATTASSQQNIAPLNLGRRTGQTVFDAAMPPGTYSDLELAVSGHDFIATVTVTGSQTQTAAAETRIGAYTIFDLSLQRLGRSTVLHLPVSDFRFLHFRIAGPIQPENVTGLSVVRLPQSQPRYIAVAASSHITQKGRETLIEFTVPAHTPVDRVVFVPASQNTSFSRDVEVSVSPILPSPAANAAEPPQSPVSFGTLLRVHGIQEGHRIDEERMSVAAPTADFNDPAKWVVTVENGDDRPIDLSLVRLEMLERKLCLKAAGAASYTLYYDDPALAAPHYDYAALFTPQADAAQAGIGPETPNPGYTARPDERPFTEKHPALLWAALVFVIVLLAGVALRSTKPPQIRPS